MKYTVIWIKSARALLAQVWLDAPNRQAVADAADRIDQILKHDPEIKGESRENYRRVLFEAPLGDVFKVEPLDRMVFVTAVWEY
jgi:hypothetical protein